MVRLLLALFSTIKMKFNIFECMSLYIGTFGSIGWNKKCKTNGLDNNIYLYIYLTYIHTYIHMYNIYLTYIYINLYSNIFIEV